MRKISARWGIFLGIAFLAIGIFRVSTIAAAGRLQGSPAPELSNQTWINSPPLRLADLRGRVVLLEFWTYG